MPHFNRAEIYLSSLVRLAVASAESGEYTKKNTFLCNKSLLGILKYFVFIYIDQWRLKAIYYISVSSPTKLLKDVVK